MKGESKYRPIVSVLDMKTGVRIVYREGTRHTMDLWTYLEYPNGKVL